MVCFKFLKLFYGLYTDVYFRCRIPHPVRWIAEVAVFIQYIFYLIDFHAFDLPHEQENNLFRIVNHCGMFFPWIFSTDNYSNSIYGSLILNFIIIIYVASLVVSKKSSSHIFYVSFTVLLFWQLIYFKIFAAPTFLKFGFTIIAVIKKQTKENITLFCIQTVNFLIYAVNEYISAIFLQPCMFNVTCSLDIYDTKKNIVVFFSRCFFIVSQLLLIKVYSIPLEIVTLIISFALCTYLIFCRAVSGAHSSFWGLYFELYPLLSQPIMLLINLHGNSTNLLNFLDMLVLAVLFGVILFLYRFFIRKYCVIIFDEFMSPNLVVKSRKPFFLAYDVANVFRLIAVEVGDVETFKNLLVMRQRRKTSQFIEIVRFLGVFPSHRQQLLSMLETWESHSNYHCFQIHLFQEILSSYVRNAPEDATNVLDGLHRMYLVHLYQFWHDRYENNWFGAFKSGINAMLVHSELSAVIASLLSRYPFDSSIRTAYSELQMIAFGDPKGSVRSRKLASMLRESSSCVDDPLMKIMGQKYPRATQYFAEEQAMLSELSITESTSGSLSKGMRFHFEQNVIERNNGDNSPTAMYVQKDKSAKVCGFIPSCFCAFVVMLVFVIFCCVFEFKFENAFNQFAQDYDDMLLRMNSVIASAILPFASYPDDYFDENFNITFNFTEESCSNYLYDLYDRIDTFFSYLDSETSQDITIEALVYHYINSMTVINMSKCEKLRTIFAYPGNYARIASNEAAEYSEKYLDNIDKIEKLAKENFRITDFVIGTIVCCIIYTLVFNFSMFIHLNVHMKDLPRKAVEFLGSKSRLGLLLFKRSMESWDVFSMLFPVEKEEEEKIEEKKIPIRKSPSNIRASSPFLSTLANKEAEKQPVADKSRHVDLKDSKLSVSFIGTDDVLRASQFELLKPYLKYNVSSEASTTTTASNANDPPSTSSIEEEPNITTESIEEMEIVNTAINETMDVTKNYYLISSCILAVPMICALLVLLFFLPALTQRTDKVLDQISVLKENYTLFKEVLKCDIHLANVSIKDRSKYIEKLNNSKKYVDDANTNISNLWTTRYNTSLGISVSASEVTYLFGSRVLNFSLLYPHYVPIIVNFSYLAFHVEMKEEIDAMEVPDTSNIYSFFIDFVLIIITICYVFKYFDELGAAGLNSLFHFPHNYMDNYNKKKDLPPDFKLPNTIIQVISSVETGFIYSVSENVSSILNRQPIEFIGRKLDDMFPVASSDGVEKRSFQITERKTKVFSTSKIQSEHIINTALFDESDMSSSANMAQAKANLSAFIPQAYAKKYYEDGLSQFFYNDAYPIIVRFKIDDPSVATEKIFSASNTLIQGFRSLHLLWIQGGSILFVCEKTDLIVPLLFIRDFLEACKPNPRSDDDVISISIARDDVKAELCRFNEPYVDVTYKSFVEQIRFIPTLPPKTLCVFGELSKSLTDAFGELREENGISMRTLPFSNIRASLDTLL